MGAPLLSPLLIAFYQTIYPIRSEDYYECEHGDRNRSDYAAKYPVVKSNYPYEHESRKNDTSRSARLGP